jgi:hypothetical protein
MFARYAIAIAYLLCLYGLARATSWHTAVFVYVLLWLNRFEQDLHR